VRIRHFLSHFALTSTPRELSFLRSMRTARQTRSLRGGNADSVGDFLVGLVFDERESGDEAVFRGELEKRSPEAATQFALGGRIAPGSGGEILGKLGFLPRVAEMIQGRVGGNAAGPGAKIPRGGVEPPACPINAPKRLHGQILGGAAVANDAHGPGVDLLLVLAKESLKGFEVARRESFEQLHRPHSIRTYCQGGCEVTASFEWSEYTGESVQKNGATGDGLHWSRSFRTGSILKKGGECALAGVWHTPLK